MHNHKLLRWLLGMNDLSGERKEMQDLAGAPFYHAFLNGGSAPARSILPYLLVLLTVVGVWSGCKKQAVGFLSDNLYYLENPFFVAQGVTTVSGSLVADGSTAPMQVTLTGIREKKSGKSVDSVFLKPQAMVVFSGNVTYNDSTPEILRSKLKDSLVAPFSINSVGGRLQFTGTTTVIPLGSYTMDVNVTNVRGTKTLTEACDINILPPEYFVQAGASYSYLLDTITQVRVSATPVLTATHDTAGPAMITIKWVDENGKVYNPAKGEVLARAGLASFQNWDPYYDVQLTDTAFVFRYPDRVPVFPVFNPAQIGGGVQADYWCYYRIPAAYIAESGQEYRLAFAFKLPNAVGTYNVTIKTVGGHRK